MQTRKRTASTLAASPSRPIPCRIAECNERGTLYGDFIDHTGYISLCHEHAQFCGICGEPLRAGLQRTTWCLFERVTAHRLCVHACTERQYEFSLRHKIAAVRLVTDAWCDKIASDTGCIRVSIFGQFLKDWLDAAHAWDEMLPLARSREAARNATMSILVMAAPRDPDACVDEEDEDDCSWSSVSSADLSVDSDESTSYSSSDYDDDGECVGNSHIRMSDVSLSDEDSDGYWSEASDGSIDLEVDSVGSSDDD